VLPESHFVHHVPDGPIDESAIRRLAKLYKVSRSVVLRRLYELKRVSKNEYEEKEGKYVADYIRQRGAKGGGGNYYLTQVAYLGRTYIALVMNAYRRKKLSRQQLAEFLGVRAHSLEGLEQASFARPAAA
jgi:Zn-dependent peptidase ImmA (M78 family)